MIAFYIEFDVFITDNSGEKTRIHVMIYNCPKLDKIFLLNKRKVKNV